MTIHLSSRYARADAGPPRDHGGRLPRRRRDRQRRRRAACCRPRRDGVRADAGPAREGDGLRRLLLREPRGSVACHANLVVPRDRRTATPASSSWSRPSTRRCRARTRSAPRPCCSRPAWSRCASPRRCCGWRRPGGVVEVRAACRDGRCESVEFTNVPCFADRLDAPLEVDGPGHDHRRRRLRRHVVRDRRRGRAGLRDRAGRGPRAVAGRRADPRGRARAAALRPPREPRDRRRQHRPDRRAVAGRRRRSAETRSWSRPGGSTARPPAPGSRRGWRCCTPAG